MSSEYGQNIKLTVFGESHASAVGVVIGGAVVQGEDGHTVGVRFFYLPVTDAAKALDSSTLKTVTDGLTV